MVVKAFETITLARVDDGSDGAPGKPGIDGKTPYFHQAWADSKDGKVNFSTIDPTNRGYLGTYSDFTQADSTDPSKYFWVELVGAFEVGGINLIVRKDELVNRMIGPTGTIDQFAGSSVTKNIISVEPGKYLTLTRYNSAADNYFRFAFYDASGAVVKYAANDDWSHTEEVPPKSATFRISYNTNLTVKLERGRKSSEYTLAPEDTQEQIDTVNNALTNVNKEIAAVTKVDAQAATPTDPKKGDQWWVKDANGEINAFKIWDGTKWAPSTITQSLLVIKELDAVNVNSSVINGSKFTSNFSQEHTEDNKTGPLFEGVQTIGDGMYTVDYKVKDAKAQHGYTDIRPDGIISYVTDEDGNMQDYGSLIQGSFHLMNKNASGYLYPEDLERTGREVWTTHAGANGDQIMGLSKQFRRVWFDGTLFIPQGQWNGNIGNYNKVLQIKDHKLYPKSNKIIGVTTLGNNSETASIQVQPDGWIVVVWSSRAQRILVEGCFYTLDF